MNNKFALDPSGGKALIYLISEGAATDENYAAEAARLLGTIERAAGRFSLIQIREKHLSARRLYQLTAEAARITKNTPTKMLVNDRADIALAAGADGVHLPSNAMPASVVRAAFPKNFIVGASTHSREKAVEAERAGADFVTFSPIFASPGKSAPRGLSALREVCQAVTIPVIALGGINETNYREVSLIAGGFAAIRFLNDPKYLNNANAFFEINER